MQRFIGRAITLVAGVVYAMTAVAQAQPAGQPQGQRVSQQLVCKNANFQVITPCDLGYDTGKARGKITYDAQAAGSNESMQLQLHGLQPDTWYLVTLQDPTGAHQFSARSAACLFGVKQDAPGVEFCDAALVRTDCHGKVRGLMPTDAGLTGMPSPVCANGNVPALRLEPHLGHGTYTGLTLVVKNVGTGLDGTTPDCLTLSTGGTAELFERDVLPAFTAP